MLSSNPTFHCPLSLSSRGSLVLLHFLPYEWCPLHMLLIFLLEILIPACASSSPAFYMMYSAYKQGDNIQHWYTPFSILNQSIVPCLVLTIASWPAYRFLRRQVRWSDIPISLIMFHSFFVVHTIKGFSIPNEADDFLSFPCFSMIQQTSTIWSPISLKVLGSCTVEAYFGKFWALLC